MDEPAIPFENIYIQLKKRPAASQRMFFCIICRKGIFKYNDRVVSICPGDPDSEGERISNFPLKVRCGSYSPNHGMCPAIYVVEGIVE